MQQSLGRKSGLHCSWENVITHEPKSQGLNFQSSVHNIVQKPEDHPAYHIEWGMFWERRYQELLCEGKDPDSYDFKPEWISYWNNRMKELSMFQLTPQKSATSNFKLTPQKDVNMSTSIFNERERNQNSRVGYGACTWEEGVDRFLMKANSGRRDNFNFRKSNFSPGNSVVDEKKFLEPPASKSECVDLRDHLNNLRQQKSKGPETAPKSPDFKDRDNFSSSAQASKGSELFLEPPSVGTNFSPQYGSVLRRSPDFQPNISSSDTELLQSKVTDFREQKRDVAPGKRSKSPSLKQLKSEEEDFSSRGKSPLSLWENSSADKWKIRSPDFRRHRSKSKSPYLRSSGKSPSFEREVKTPDFMETDKNSVFDGPFESLGGSIKPQSYLKSNDRNSNFELRLEEAIQTSFEINPFGQTDKRAQQKRSRPISPKIWQDTFRNATVTKPEKVSRPDIPKQTYSTHLHSKNLEKSSREESIYDRERKEKRIPWERRSFEVEPDSLTPGLVEDKHGILGLLRLVLAIEDLLGTLAPQVTVIVAKAMALESEEKDSSRKLLEDPDVATVLEMTKEKLAGLIVSDLLASNKGLAVRVCIDKINEALIKATRKRPPNLPDLTKKVPENPQDEIKNKYLGLLKVLFADALSSELMKRGRAEITEEKLYKLVYQIVKGTCLDSGNLRSPPPSPPPSSSRSRVAPASVQKCELWESLDKSLNKYDQLTLRELQNRLENFGDLEKSDQIEVIAYIKKLESSNPQRLKQVKVSKETLGFQDPLPPFHQVESRQPFPRNAVENPGNFYMQGQNFNRNWGTMQPTMHNVQPTIRQFSAPQPNVNPVSSSFSMQLHNQRSYESDQYDHYYQGQPDDFQMGYNSYNQEFSWDQQIPPGGYHQSNYHRPAQVELVSAVNDPPPPPPLPYYSKAPAEQPIDGDAPLVSSSYGYGSVTEAKERRERKFNYGMTSHQNNPFQGFFSNNGMDPPNQHF